MSVDRTQISVYISNDLIKWLDEEVKNGRFRNKSHGFDFALEQLKKSS